MMSRRKGHRKEIVAGRALATSPPMTAEQTDKLLVPAMIRIGWRAGSGSGARAMDDFGLVARFN